MYGPWARIKMLFVNHPLGAHYVSQRKRSFRSKNKVVEMT